MFNKLQKSVSEALEFPPDVVGDGPRITLSGRRQVIVENYKVIISFTGEEIVLDTSEGEFYLNGRELILKTILPTELRIEGEFTIMGYRITTKSEVRGPKSE